MNALWGSMRLHLLFEPLSLSLKIPLGSSNGIIVSIIKKRLDLFVATVLIDDNSKTT